MTSNAPGGSKASQSTVSNVIARLTSNPPPMSRDRAAPQIVPAAGERNNNPLSRG